MRTQQISANRFSRAGRGLSPRPASTCGQTAFAFWMLILVLATGWSLPVGADEAVPADAAPRWWKGNLHTHTLWSDGDDFPEMVAEWYRTRGYHFLALSDHNVLAVGNRWMAEQTVRKRGGDEVVDKYLARFGPAWVERRGEGEKAAIRLKPLAEFRCLVEERGRFLMIPAEEISDRAEGKPVHINASNIVEPIQPVGGGTVVEAIQGNLRAVRDQAERAGQEIIAHLNHPNFGYAVTPADLAQATLEQHFEVFNGHPGVNQQGDDKHPSVEMSWDIANTIRLDELHAAPLFGIATDDSHNYHSYPGEPKASRPGRGWVFVRATHLTPEHIVRALKHGDFYASSGVSLREVVFDESAQTLRLQIEPAGDATYTTHFIASFAATDDQPARIGVEVAASAGLTASYRLTGEELYVRARVTSSEPPADPVWKGQRAEAWTQPVGWRAELAGDQ